MRRRVYNALGLAWWWYAQIAGVTVPSVAVAYAVVNTFANEGEVWRSENFVLHTPMVRVGESVSFTVDLYANESCAGDVTTTLASVTNHGPPAIVTFRRPLMRPGLNAKEVPGIFQLSEAVGVGAWDVVHAIESKCPKRTRLDNVAEFRLTVIP